MPGNEARPNLKYGNKKRIGTHNDGHNRHTEKKRLRQMYSQSTTAYITGNYHDTGQVGDREVVQTRISTAMTAEIFQIRTGIIEISSCQKRYQL